MNIQLVNLVAAVSRLSAGVQSVSDAHKTLADQLTAALAKPQIDEAAIEIVAQQIDDIATKLATVGDVSVAAPTPVSVP